MLLDRRVQTVGILLVLADQSFPSSTKRAIHFTMLLRNKLQQIATTMQQWV
jgi:hypothetical protein